jgi:hypothetical protein
MGNLVIKQSEQQKNQLILANIPSKERKLIVLYLDTKKIRNYNPEEHSKFHDFIKMICRNSGIKEMEVNNNTHTLQMAFAQIFTEIDVNHYGMPTPLWFGRILSAYKQKLNLELIKFTRQIEKSNLLSEPEISEIESDNIMALSIIESFNDYKLNKTIGDSGNAKFNFLSKKGFIVLSEKQKQDLMIRAEKSILDNSLLPKSERTIFMTVVDSLKGGLPADKLRIEARKISLRDYYDLIISNKDNINQILHNYLIKK